MSKSTTQHGALICIEHSIYPRENNLCFFSVVRIVLCVFFLYLYYKLAAIYITISHPSNMSAAPTNPLVSNVDATFYQLQTEDLRKKIDHMRAALQSRREHNADFEERIRITETERTDELAQLDERMQAQTIEIRDLREVLADAQRRLVDARTERERRLREEDMRQRLMHETQTSELKLQLSTLNSLREFQLQRDALRAKLAAQDADLLALKAEQAGVLTGMDRQESLAKSKLKRVIEGQVCDIALRVAQTNEVQIPAHVRRLVRENIALGSDLDRMHAAQTGLCRANDGYLAERKAQRSSKGGISAECSQLVRTCDVQLARMRHMTSKLEQVQAENAKLANAEALCKAAQRLEAYAEREHRDYERHVHRIEQIVQAERTASQHHSTALRRLTVDVERLKGLLLLLRMHVKSAKRGEQCMSDDVEFRVQQRKNLLSDLMAIVQQIHDGPPAIASMATVRSVDSVCSDQLWNVQQSMMYMAEEIGQRKPVGILPGSVIMAGERMHNQAVDMYFVRHSSCESIYEALDVDTDSDLFKSDLIWDASSWIVQCSNTTSSVFTEIPADSNLEGDGSPTSGIDEKSCEVEDEMDEEIGDEVMFGGEEETE